MPATKCGGCAKFLSPIEGVTCSLCDGVYHRACVGLPKGYTSPSWRCPECSKNERRDNKTETPVRGRVDATPGLICETVCSPSTLDGEPCNVGKPPISDITTELRLLKEDLCAEFRLMRHEVQQLRSEMNELKASLKACDDHMHSLDARVDALELKLQEKAMERGSVDDDIAGLKLQLNERDQELLLNDVEVNGIPEGKEESPLHLVKLLSRTLGVAIEEQDIVNATRIGPLRRNLLQSSSGPPDSDDQRPRGLVVRFARRVTRDTILQAARVRRGFTVKELGIGGSVGGGGRRIFVNERLTSMNRYLFYKARQAGSLHNWRYVWTREGKILTRRQDGQQVQRVRCEGDIARIFG